MQKKDTQELKLSGKSKMISEQQQQQQEGQMESIQEGHLNTVLKKDSQELKISGKSEIFLLLFPIFFSLSRC